MFLTVHATAGLVIAQVSPNPLVTFVLALASHFVLDFIPHGDEHIAPRHLAVGARLRRLAGAGILDAIILAGFLAIYLWTSYVPSGWNLAAALIGSLLPDALMALYLATDNKMLAWFDKFHKAVHNLPEHKMDWAHGMFVQILAFTALWLILL